MPAAESIIRLEGIEKLYVLGGEVEVRALRGVDLIDSLNAQGKTIVLVTHDDRVARRAHRVLHMRDGRIEREVTNPRKLTGNGAGTPDA